MRARKPSKEFCFFLYDPEGEGMMYYNSKEQRDKSAAQSLEFYKDDYSGWNEEVEYVSVGEVTDFPQVMNKIEKPSELDDYQCDNAGRHWPDDVEWFGDYTLEPV